VVDERALITELRRHYKKIYIPLDQARTDEEFEIYGDFILVEDLVAGTKCEIKLNSKQNDAIDLKRVRKIESPFSKFYLSNDAYTGGYVKLLIGGEAKFSATAPITAEIEEARVYAYDGTSFVPLRIDSTNNGTLVKVVEIPNITADQANAYAYNGTSFVPVQIDPSNNGVLVKVVEIPARSYNTDSITSIGKALEVDLGTFTAAGTGTSQDVYPGYKIITWQQINDAGVTNPDIRLEGSIDNSNWFELDRSSELSGELRHVVNRPVRYIRANVVDMGGATEISVKAFLKDA